MQVEPEVVGELVRSRRASCAWSQEALGEAAGVDRRTISRIENGGVPSQKTLRKFAKAFGIEVNQLLVDPTAEELENLRKRLQEFQCPHCGAVLAGRIDAPMDEDHDHWDVREFYECGFQRFAGSMESPCPSDPRFPKLEEYDLQFSCNDRGGWRCHAMPSTRMARCVRLMETYGWSKEEAADAMREQHSRRRSA